MTTYMPPEQVALNEVTRHVSISYEVMEMLNVLTIVIDEEKLVKEISKMIPTLKEIYKDLKYHPVQVTERQHVDNFELEDIKIIIGDKTIKAHQTYEAMTYQEKRGFKICK